MGFAVMVWPVNGYSVSCFRATANCRGVSCACHSASDFSIDATYSTSFFSGSKIGMVPLMFLPSGLLFFIFRNTASFTFSSEPRII